MSGTPKLWVPATASARGGEPPVAYECGFCGGQHDEKGLGRCAREHADDIEALKLRNRMPIFDPENWDKEVEDYLTKVVGPRMLREGRLEMKPNERMKDN